MSSRARKLGALFAVVLVYVVIDGAARDASPWWDEGMGGAENLDTLVEALFVSNVFAFEALGVLLTAAMIGAMIIARPLHSRLDSENYPVISDEELAATQHVSDPEGRQ